MIEGGSADGFPKALAWAKEHPASFQKLQEKISDALIEYLKMQASCGVTPYKFLIAGITFAQLIIFGTIPYIGFKR